MLLNKNLNAYRFGSRWRPVLHFFTITWENNWISPIHITNMKHKTFDIYLLINYITG